MLIAGDPKGITATKNTGHIMSHHFRKPHSEVLNFLMPIALKCFVTATLATLVTLVTYLQVSVGASNAGTPAVQVDWCERHALNVLKQLKPQKAMKHTWRAQGIW